MQDSYLPQSAPEKVEQSSPIFVSNDEQQRYKSIEKLYRNINRQKYKEQKINLLIKWK